MADLQGSYMQTLQVGLCGFILRKHDHEVGLEPQDLLVIRVVIAADLRPGQCLRRKGAVACDAHDPVAQIEGEQNLGDARGKGDDAAAVCRLSTRLAPCPLIREESRLWWQIFS